MPPQISLNELQPFEYEHPFDAKALDALQKVPGLDIVVRQFYKHYTERVIRIRETGSGLKISPLHYPKIYALLDQVCDTLNLPNRPDLYLNWGYSVNGSTDGITKPIIVLNSGAIDLLNEKELLFVIGHEVGHIKSSHVLYRAITMYFPDIANVVGQATLGLGNLFSIPLQLALLAWYRMAELTADRAGLLACQDFTAANSVMMKMAGLPLSHYDKMAPDAFLEQARNFEQLNYDDLNKILKFLAPMNLDHPWTVLRTAELLRWMEVGEYQKILERKTRYRWFVREDGKNSYCRKCGNKLVADEKFCTSCGGQLTPSESDKKD